eukprot:m.107763 g.107763  ORF g.107763 m.107763 type:complete len:55 (+) comp13943_c0_seq1:249-413(+)
METTAKKLVENLVVDDDDECFKKELVRIHIHLQPVDLGDIQGSIVVLSISYAFI